MKNKKQTLYEEIGGIMSMMGKLLNEANPSNTSDLPVIDFNKLPSKAFINDSATDQKLFDAGFPTSIPDPIRNNLNFSRYYDQQVGSTGDSFWTKKNYPPNPNYKLTGKEPKKPQPGFSGKYSCITKQNPQKYIPQDTNGDKIIDMYTTSSSQGTVRYYPNGKSKALLAGSNSMGPDSKNAKWVDSTWYCSGDKVIDSFIQNKNKMKSYKGSPFVDDGSGDPKRSYIPIGTTDRGSDGKYITNLQNKLIELNYLNIPSATGNYGNMTQRAILTAFKTSSEKTGNNDTYFGDISKGINKHMYDTIIGGTKIGNQTFKFT